MPWPLSQDYNEAIQTPAQCFSDPELRQSEAVCNAMGLPIPCSGNFADVYAVEAGQQKWAVKCFTRQIQGLRERYAEISKYLAKVQLPFMVDFKFLEQGIRVRGQWYPILKMQWVEGQTLNGFVKSQLDNPAILRTVSSLWAKMGTVLREANLAHGDLQHGNVLLVPGSTAGKVGLKLVDYDGMCVPALELLKANEVGHPAYQHPQRLREGTYGLHIDRFSHLVIYTALRSLVVGGRGLWEKYDNGDNLLFSQKDFEKPQGSALFQDLLKVNDPEVKKLVQAVAAVSQKSVEQTPLLDELVSTEFGKMTDSTVKPVAPGASGQRTGISVAVSAPASAPADVEATWSAVATRNARPTRPHKRKSAIGMALGIAGILAVVATVSGFVLLGGANKENRENHGKLASTQSASSTVSQKAIPSSERVFVFSGKQQHISTPLERFAPVTMEAWIKVAHAPPPNRTSYLRRYIFGSDIIGHGGYGIGLWYNQDKTVGGLQLETLSSFFNCTIPPPISKWCHIAVVFGQEHLAIFYDGIRIYTARHKLPPPRGGTPFIIGGVGKDNLGEDCFIGEMREIRLSRGERYIDTFTPPATFTKDQSSALIYHASKTNGSLALDLSGEGNDGRMSDVRTEQREVNALHSVKHQPQLKVVYLADMKESDVKMGPYRFGKGETGGGEPGQWPIRIREGIYSKGLGMTPPANGFSSVKYVLNKSMKRFHSLAALMTPDRPAVSQIAFQVLGDGKVIWSSEPTKVAEQVQDCKVDISQVDALELRVNCPGQNIGAFAMWLDPYVTP